MEGVMLVALNPHQDDEYTSAHGIPMTEEAFGKLIQAESPYSYELIGGIAYNMTGSSPKHSALSSRIDLLLSEQLGRRGPCHTHRDQYVAIPDRPPVVPDMVLTCDRADWNDDEYTKPFKIRSPLIVIEVLSSSTEAYDRGEKFARYQRCSTLEVYILVSQVARHIEVYRKNTGWRQEVFTGMQFIQLDQLDLELSLEEIYEGILKEV
jgi:Uma2 family endonuclease